MSQISWNEIADKITNAIQYVTDLAPKTLPLQLFLLYFNISWLLF